MCWIVRIETNIEVFLFLSPGEGVGVGLVNLSHSRIPNKKKTIPQEHKIHPRWAGCVLASVRRQVGDGDEGGEVAAGGALSWGATGVPIVIQEHWGYRSGLGM